jgi:hypothetical protein
MTLEELLSGFAKDRHVTPLSAKRRSRGAGLNCLIDRASQGRNLGLFPPIDLLRCLGD